MLIRRWCAGSAMLFASLLSGCGPGGGADVPGYVVRDSAGVQIVENTPGTWAVGSEWRLSAEPEVHIGLVDGAPEYQFTRVAAARRLSDGRIAASDAGTNQIRIYSGRGEHLQTLGGQGGGPGEFEQIAWIEVLPDGTLVVFDSRQMRFSTFAPTGAFVGTSPVPSQHGRIMPLGRFADGSILGTLMTSFGPGEATTGPHRATSTYLRLSADAASLDTITALRGGESYVRASGSGMSVSGMIFGRGAVHTVRGARLFAGETDTYQIGVYSGAGSLERLIRLARDPRPVTEADVETERERRREGLSNVANEEVRRGFEQMLADMPIPPTMPAFSRLVIDSEDHLWVQEYAVPGTAATEWSVFDPEGRLLGTVAFPERFRVTEIGSSYVLGVWQDEFEVEHVRMYALARS